MGLIIDILCAIPIFAAGLLMTLLKSGSDADDWMEINGPGRNKRK